MDYLNMTIKDFLENPPKSEDDISREDRTSIVLAALNGLNAGSAHWILRNSKSVVLRQAQFSVDFEYLKEHLIL